MENRGVYRSFRRILTVIIVGALLLGGCGVEENQQPTITFGLGPSIYVDQVEKGIKPLLEEMGYGVELRIFSQNSMIPVALKEGAVDVSVHISTANLHEMNRRLGGEKMIVWADTPSAPQTLRSSRHSSLDDVRDGMRIAIPNDPVNAERAARLLEEIGWVTLAPDLEIATFHIDEVKPGSVELEILEVEAAQMLRVMEDLDFVIVNGNYVTNAGLRIQDGLAIEDSPPEHLVKVAILEKNREEPWALAIKEVYQSAEFEAYIKSEPLYGGLIFPQRWERE